MWNGDSRPGEHRHADDHDGKDPDRLGSGTRWEYVTNIDFVAKAVEAVSCQRGDARSSARAARHERTAFKNRWHAQAPRLYSTTGDNIKFTQLILNKGRGNGNQVLRPKR
ncbi:hypothetical protein ML401_39050 (plasmid) [Bradyrhizobium sp. 62B]|nr:hypothetical protein ML401_39050 [Bradyrhizobium sp. 62B]